MILTDVRQSISEHLVIYFHNNLLYGNQFFCSIFGMKRLRNPFSFIYSKSWTIYVTANNYKGLLL